MRHLAQEADRAGRGEWGWSSVSEALPKTTRSTPIYEGRVVKIRVDEISMPNGVATTREVVDHPGAVVIVALDDDQRVYLVRQYRHAIGSMLLELPAGTLEPGEEPLEAAKRELREEVGITGERWSYLGSFFSSPGFLNEKLDVFLAEDLTPCESDPDFDEELTVVTMRLSELVTRPAETPDAKTLAALHLLEEISRRGDET